MHITICLDVVPRHVPRGVSPRFARPTSPLRLCRYAPYATVPRICFCDACSFRRVGVLRAKASSVPCPCLSDVSVHTIHECYMVLQAVWPSWGHGMPTRACDILLSSKGMMLLICCASFLAMLAITSTIACAQAVNVCPTASHLYGFGWHAINGACYAPWRRRP